MDMRRSHPGRQTTARTRVALALTLLVALGGVARAGDKPKSASTRKAAKSAKASEKGSKSPGKTVVKPAVVAKPGSEANPLPAPKGKVVVFAFTGAGAGPIYKEVLHLFQAKGLKVQTSIRPMDSPEQYRELAQTLDLIAFIDGETEVDGAQGSATIHVRNGVTGLRVASSTVAGDKKKLPAELGRAVWDQLVNALAQATVDAAGPRRHDRAPMRIEAGTPLTNTPTEAAAP